MPRKDTSCITAPPRPAAQYDIVGDVHGCMDELLALVRRAGYQVAPFDPDASDPIEVVHPKDRILVFAGDLTDRGPKSDQVLRMVIGMIKAGTGLSVMGNHDWKLLRYLRGADVKINNGLATTIEQLDKHPQALRDAVRDLLELTPHQVRLPLPEGHPRYADGYMTVVHGAAPRHHQDVADKNSFSRGIFGYPTGKTGADGGIERQDWALDYDGLRTVVHGHTPMAKVREKNRVICLDTGCVFGGHLTMYQVDTGDLLLEPARMNYSGKIKHLA
jgi:hypothetical protein